MENLRIAQEQGVVQGLRGILPVTARLDVDVLITEFPDTFNLFCLAMLDLTRCKSSDLMGFYQIAGIHGFPKCLWDDIPSPQKDQMGSGPKAYSGYCSHSSPMFPTWHRPYLVMFEQTLFLKMMELAERFPENVRELYREAARQFRFPYWDYFRPRAGQTQFPGVGAAETVNYPYNFKAPDIFNVPKVVLRTPKSNNLELCDNPFYIYTFPTTGGIPDADWDTLYLCVKSFSKTETQRFPLSDDPVQDFNLTLNKAREDGIRYAINIISEHDKYENLYNTKNDTKKGSLESLHDDYHDRIGGQGGHMSRVPTAAFDPLFWFHHCQIDRYFAIWQKVHPDQWFDAGDVELTPMRKSKTPQTFWTSEDSRDTATFGYTYPDLDGSPEEVKDKFVQSYSWATEKAEYRPSPPASMAPLDLSRAQVFQYDEIEAVIPGDVAALELSKSQVRSDPVADPQNWLLHNIEKRLNPNVTDLQANSVRFAMTSDLTENETEAGKASVKLFEAATSVNSVDTLRASSITGTDREWYIDFEVERLSLNGSFTIYYFLGDPPDNDICVGRYMTWPTLATSSHVFAAPVEACQKCSTQKRTGHVISNTSHLTAVLKDYVRIGELVDLHPGSVERFFVKNLKWRVISTNGVRIDPRTISSLKFNVISKAISQRGTIAYEEHPGIVKDIIAGSSRIYRRPTGVQAHRFVLSL